MVKEKSAIKDMLAEKPKSEMKAPDIRRYGKDVKPDICCSCNVKYYLYKSDSMAVPDKILEDFKENNVSACFSGLEFLLKDNQKLYNRMLYVFQQSVHCGSEDGRGFLDFDTKMRWINMSIEHHALPKYILDSDIKKGKFVIQLDEENLSPSLLYTYLSTLRVMTDDIGFVKNMIVLVDTYKMSYYLAWVLASKISHNNSNHNLISVSRNYGLVNNDVNNISGINIRYGLALKAYLNNPYKYDKRSVYSGGKNTIFTVVNSALEKYKVKKPINSCDVCGVNAKYLLSDIVIKLMNTDSSRTVNALISQIKKDDTRNK